ncbi:sensor domain-containing diguanylate cyclase [Paenibacillus sp. CAU 1782]
MDVRIDNAPCGYFSISEAGTIQAINQTLLTMLSYSRQELVGRHFESTLSVTNKLFFHTYFYPYIQLYGHVEEMYLSLRTSAGEDVPVLLNGVKQTRDGVVCIDCVVLVMRKRIQHEKDTMQTKTRLEALYQETNEANKRLELLHDEYEKKQQELMEMNRRLEMLASTDPLTGLSNRRFFQEKLTTELQAHRETEQPLSLLIIDIDHFKHINDTYGHPVGDLVLSELAKLLQGMSRESDLFARFGGEEFVALVPGAAQDDATAFAESICVAAASTSMGGYQITISIGVATAIPQETELSIVQKADTALYASKSSGRNRVTHWAVLPPSAEAATK